MASLVRAQAGVASHRQLLEAGITPGALEARVRAGRLFPIHRGVYALSPVRLSSRGRLWAAQLACGSTSLISHTSAAALWRLLRERPGPVHVTIVGMRRHRAGIAVHRVRIPWPEDRTSREGLPVTSVPRTLLDLAGSEPRQGLIRAMSEADRLGLLRMAEVQELLDRCRGHRGRGVLRRAVGTHLIPEPTRSELEERFLELVRGAGLPVPEVNARIAGLEVDMSWPRQRLAVELDGLDFHSGRLAAERDRSRDLILREAGFDVIRLTWGHVARQPRRVVSVLEGRLSPGG